MGSGPSPRGSDDVCFDVAMNGSARMPATVGMMFLRFCESCIKSRRPHKTPFLLMARWTCCAEASTPTVGTLGERGHHNHDPTNTIATGDLSSAWVLANSDGVVPLSYGHVMQCGKAVDAWAALYLVERQSDIWARRVCGHELQLLASGSRTQ